MSQTGEPNTSTLSQREWKAYETFKDLHQMYLVSGGRHPELSDKI